MSLKESVRIEINCNAILEVIIKITIIDLMWGREGWYYNRAIWWKSGVVLHPCGRKGGGGGDRRMGGQLVVNRPITS